MHLEVLLPYQVMLKGINCCLGAVANLKFSKNVGDVGFNCLKGDEKFISNTLIFIALGD